MGRGGGSKSFVTKRYEKPRVGGVLLFVRVSDAFIFYALYFLIVY